MKTFLLSILLLGCTNLFAQNLIGEDIITKVRWIKTDTTEGSSTLININNRDYILTARHLFKSDVKHGATVVVRFQNVNGWRPMTGRILTHQFPYIDLALIELETNDVINGFDAFNDNSDVELFLTQECFFLGYPLGLKMEDYHRRLNDGFPIPFAKKGIVSGFSGNPFQRLIYLDAHNNKGFSGGPVLSFDSSRRIILVGVVSRFLYDGYEKAFKDSTDIDRMDFNQLNSGIAEICSLKHLSEILNRPID